MWLLRWCKIFISKVKPTQRPASDNVQTISINPTSPKVNSSLTLSLPLEMNCESQRNNQVIQNPNDNTQVSDSSQIDPTMLRVTLPPEMDSNASRNDAENHNNHVRPGGNSILPPTYEEVQQDKDVLPSYASFMKK